MNVDFYYYRISDDEMSKSEMTESHVNVPPQIFVLWDSFES